MYQLIGRGINAKKKDSFTRRHFDGVYMERGGGEGKQQAFSNAFWQTDFVVKCILAVR